MKAPVQRQEEEQFWVLLDPRKSEIKLKSTYALFQLDLGGRDDLALTLRRHLHPFLKGGLQVLQYLHTQVSKHT